MGCTSCSQDKEEYEFVEELMNNCGGNKVDSLSSGGTRRETYSDVRLVLTIHTTVMTHDGQAAGIDDFTNRVF